MAGRLAILCLAALVLAGVLLSGVEAADATTIAAVDDAAMDDDGVTTDGTDGSGMSSDGGPDDGFDDSGAMDDAAADDDGDGVSGGDGDDAPGEGDGDGRTDQDDVGMEENSEDEEMADEGDEGKAGTGKRSIGDSWNDFKGKASTMWEDAKKKFKEEYEDKMGKFKDAMNKWSEKIKGKFSGLPQGIRDKIFKGNVSGLTNEEIDKLNKNQLRMLVPMGRLATLNASMQEKVYERFKTLDDGQSMRRVLESMGVMNRTTLINRMAEVNSKMGSNEKAKERLVMVMAPKLGDPRNWTAADVDLLKTKNVLKFIPPPSLMRISDSAILSKITIPAKTETDKMKPAMQAAWAELILHQKMAAKDVSTWSPTDISGRVKDSLAMAPLAAVRMIKNATLYDAFSSAPSPSTKFGRKQGELMAKKLMSEFRNRTSTPTPADVKNFATKRLGSPLMMFVEPEDLEMMVDPTLRNKTSEMSDMLRSAIRGAAASRGKRCDVFRRTQQGVNLATLTSTQINSIVADGSLSCVPQMYIQQWVADNKLTVDSAVSSAGRLSPGKLRAMARTAANMTRYQAADGSLDLTKLPAALLSAAGASDIRDADWAKLKTKLKESGAAKLDKAQRLMYVKKGSASAVVDADLGPDYTELVPVSDLKALSASKKKMAAMTASPDSPLRMLSAADPETAVPEAITADNAGTLEQPGLPFLDAKMVAQRISSDDIQAVLEKLREMEDKSADVSGMGGLSRRMCATLKKSLANFTQLLYLDDDDDASILGTLTGAELESLPPCITGRLGAKKVEELATDEQKMAILGALGQMKPTQMKMMSKQNLQGLVRQGLKAMRPSGDLTVAEADVIGRAASSMDAADIRRLDADAFDTLKMYFQDDCLSKDQADAVTSQLVKYNGRPDQWTNLQPLCGLLPLLDDSELREIPVTRLSAACGQDGAGGGSDSMARFKRTTQMICQGQLTKADYSQLMERRENMGRRVARGVLMAQSQLIDELDTSEASDSAPAAETAARRRRRAAEPKLTCSVVQEGDQGATAWTGTQLGDMDANEVKMCQKELGSRMADDDKLKAIWEKLKEAYDNDAANVPMKNIGTVATVIPVDDVKKLNLSTYDAVSALGQPMMMSQDQLMELAKRAKADYSGLSGDAAGFVADDLMAAGQILCGMDAAEVAKIPSAQLKSSLKLLSEVHWCQPAVTEKLAEKSLELNGGDPATLGTAEVAEMGALIGGLEAMQLKAIKNESMAGMTAAGMKSISPSKIEVLTADQVRFFSPAAAYSVSSAQLDRMPDDAKKALEEVKEADGKAGNAAGRPVAGVLTPLLVTLLALTAARAA